MGLKAAVAFWTEHVKNLYDLLAMINDIIRQDDVAIAILFWNIEHAKQAVISFNNFIKGIDGLLKAYQQAAAIYAQNVAVWAAAQLAWNAYGAKCLAAIAQMSAIPPMGFSADSVRLSTTPVPGWIHVFGNFWAKDPNAAQQLSAAAGTVMRQQAITQLMAEVMRANSEEAGAIVNKATAEAGLKAAQAPIGDGLGPPSLLWYKANGQAVLKELQANVPAEIKRLDTAEGLLSEALFQRTQIAADINFAERSLSDAQAKLAACLATPDPPPCPDEGPAISIVEYALTGPIAASPLPVPIPPPLPKGPTQAHPADPAKPPTDPTNPQPPPTTPPVNVPVVVGAVPLTASKGTKTPTGRPTAPTKITDPGHQSPLRRALERALAEARAYVRQLQRGGASPTEIAAAEDHVNQLLHVIAESQDADKVDFGTLAQIYKDMASQMSYVKGLRNLINSEKAHLDKLAAENKGTNPPKWDLRPNGAVVQALQAELTAAEQRLGQMQARLDQLSPIDTPSGGGGAGGTGDSPVQPPAGIGVPTGVDPATLDLSSLQGLMMQQAEAISAINAQMSQLQAQLDAAYRSGSLTQVAELMNTLRELAASRAEHLTNLGSLGSLIPASVSAMASGVAHHLDLPAPQRVPSGKTTEQSPAPSTKAPPPVDQAKADDLTKQINGIDAQIKANQDRWLAIDKGEQNSQSVEDEIKAIRARNINLNTQRSDLDAQRQQALGQQSTVTTQPTQPASADEVQAAQTDVHFWDQQIAEANVRMAQAANAGNVAAAARTNGAIVSMEHARTKAFSTLLDKLGLSPADQIDPASVPLDKLPEAAQLAAAARAQGQHAAEVAGLLNQAYATRGFDRVPALLKELHDSTLSVANALTQLQQLVGAAPTATGAGQPQALPTSHADGPPIAAANAAESLRVRIADYDTRIRAAMAEVQKGGDTRGSDAATQRLGDLVSTRDSLAHQLSVRTGIPAPQIRYDGYSALGKVTPLRRTTVVRGSPRPRTPPPAPREITVPGTPGQVAAPAAPVDPAAATGIETRAAAIDRTVDTLHSAIVRSAARGDTDVKPLVIELNHQEALRAALSERFRALTGRPLPPAHPIDTPGGAGTPTHLEGRPHTQEKAGTGAATRERPVGPIDVVGLPEDQVALVQATQAWAAAHLGSDSHPLVGAIVNLGRQVGVDKVHDLVDRLHATTSAGALIEIVHGILADVKEPALRVRLRAGLVDSLRGMQLDPDLRSSFSTTENELASLLPKEVDTLVNEALADGSLPALSAAAIALDSDPELGGNRRDPRLSQIRTRLQPMLAEVRTRQDAEDKALIANWRTTADDLKRIGLTALSEGRYATAVDAFAVAIQRMPRHQPPGGGGLRTPHPLARRRRRQHRPGPGRAGRPARHGQAALRRRHRPRLEIRLGIPPGHDRGPR